MTALARFTSAALTLLFAGPLVAHAALGGSAASVQADGAALRAADTTTAMPGYDRHTLTTAGGGSVHEYTVQGGSGAGAVFAVAFAGPTMPDLKTVLGTHYDAFVAAARAHRGNHHVLSFVADDGMVVSIVKLQRGFQGQAHLPAQMPRGFNFQDQR